MFPVVWARGGRQAATYLPVCSRVLHGAPLSLTTENNGISFAVPSGHLLVSDTPLWAPQSMLYPSKDDPSLARPYWSSREENSLAGTERAPVCSPPQHSWRLDEYASMHSCCLMGRVFSSSICSWRHILSDCQHHGVRGREFHTEETRMPGAMELPVYAQHAMNGYPVHFLTRVINSRQNAGRDR